MIESRPTPTGWQHWLDVRLQHAPASRFTDPVRALNDLETGLEQPVVEVVEDNPDGGVKVKVSMFSEDPAVTPEEVAALEGIAAEMRFGDS